MDVSSIVRGQFFNKALTKPIEEEDNSSGEDYAITTGYMIDEADTIGDSKAAVALGGELE